jgi:hypothetical protein
MIILQIEEILGYKIEIVSESDSKYNDLMKDFPDTIDEYRPFD